jgi:hypothetical protein
MKVFGSILNKIIKLVMGLLDKINQTKGIQPQNTETLAPDQLNAQELEFLLLMLKQSTFKGEMVELIFNTAAKLQSQYSKQIKK